MHNFGTFFLGALTACTLWLGSLAEDLPPSPQGVVTKFEEFQSKLETRLEAQLQAALSKFQNQLQAVSNRMDALEQAAKVENKDFVRNTIPPGFERIGSRYFHKGSERVDWTTARIRCYEMGGYLASFRSEEEFNAVQEKLASWKGYWLGINRDRNGHFVSLASHKPTQFLKWHDKERNDENQRINCVLLHQGEMWDQNCGSRWNYICQADDET